MKKLFLFVFILSVMLPSFGIEEVILDLPEQQTSDYANDSSQQTLRERLKLFNEDKEFNLNETYYLLEEFLTKKNKYGIVEKVQLFGYYRGGVDFDFLDTDEDTGYEFNSINAGIKGDFKDGKTFYEARLRFNPQKRIDFLQYLPSNLYIANKSIPNNTIYIGNVRTPTGYEGGMSLTYLPFVTRAQIGRNFGNVRKVGITVKGDYDLIEYDLGGYSSESYFRSFFPGAEFAGWLNLKPLGKTNGKYGELKLGGGLTAGRQNTNYCVTGLYAEYDYKNFMANFEYSGANGYNGAKFTSTKHAEGFYTTLGYKITPKLQLVGRYDHFVPNKLYANDIRREYSAGLNWFIKGQGLKLMLNYVFCQNDLLKNSHRIIIGTQIIL